MVQVIEQKPGFGAALGAGMGSGLSKGMDNLTARLEQHRQQKELGSISEKWNEQTTPMEMFKDISSSGASPEAQKPYLDFIGTQIKQQQAQQQDLISPEGASLIEKAQQGYKPSADEMASLSEKEIRTVLRAQEVSGATGAEEEKAYLNKNLKRYDELSTEAIAERGVMRTLDEMEHLVTTGATDDIISNLVTKYDIGVLKPFLQKPGSKAYMTGFKALFNDFKATFGARPTVYEAKIYEQGLPEILSPNDAKLASIYELKAIKQAKIAESEAHNQAYSELGFKASPIEIDRRATELSELAKDEIYAGFRDQIDELTGGKISQGPDLKGGKLKKVDAGTPLSEATAQIILKKAKGDPDKATEIARGLGYAI